VTYGLGVLQTALQFRLAKWHIQNSKLFAAESRKQGIPGNGTAGLPEPSLRGGETAEAIHLSFSCQQEDGLLGCARNDG
jgi:hypothetical protein